MSVIEFRLLPDNWSVSATTPDGAYLRRTGKMAQVIVVGPMRYAPIEFEMAVNDTTEGNFGLKSVEFMTCADASFDWIALNRGYVSIMLEQGYDARRSGRGKIEPAK